MIIFPPCQIVEEVQGTSHLVRVHLLQLRLVSLFDGRGGGKDVFQILRQPNELFLALGLHWWAVVLAPGHPAKLRGEGA